MADAQLARDDAGPHAGRRHLDDLEADVVGQRPAVDEHAAQLVHAPLPCWNSASLGNNYNQCTVIIRESDLLLPSQLLIAMITLSDAYCNRHKNS